MMQEDTNNTQPSADDRPPRSKARLAFTTVLFLVVVVLLVGIFTPVRDVVINRFLTGAPTPTATLVAGGDSFYIDAAPRGTITIDEHTITNPSNLYTNEKPLTLSRGQHKIVWQVPPFLPLTCIVSVPPNIEEPCNYETTEGPSNAPATRQIVFTPTLADLPDVQQTALKQTIQNALNRLQSTDTVQPGEQYVYAPSSGAAMLKIATQPLNATLSLHLDANPASQNSCSNSSDECGSNSGSVNQNCLQFCSGYSGIPPAPSANSTQFIWNITALFYPTWSYSTPGGQRIAQNQPDTSSTSATEDHSIAVTVTWDGSTWHVKANVSLETVVKFDASPACATIDSQIANTLQYNTTANGTYVDWGYAIGANEAQGCLAAVVPEPDQGTQTNFKQPAAYFLYRFGVLLAANPLAHSEFPSIPMANTYEQGIAQGIAAKLQF